MRIYREVSTETRNKMSIAKRGERNPQYGKSVPTETREKLSRKMKEYWANIPSIHDVNR
jgi:hypothetical protein